MGVLSLQKMSKGSVNFLLKHAKIGPVMEISSSSEAQLKNNFSTVDAISSYKSSIVTASLKKLQKS